jgi:hypothetical protein
MWIIWIVYYYGWRRSKLVLLTVSLFLLKVLSDQFDFLFYQFKFKYNEILKYLKEPHLNRILITKTLLIK